MARVQRPAIQADIGAETACLHEPLRTVVTPLAERLERAEPELVDVAVMWLNVIADFRCRDDTALETERTQRVFAKLVSADPSPPSHGVPLVPLRRLASDAHISRYHPPAKVRSTGRCARCPKPQRRAGGRPSRPAGGRLLTPRFRNCPNFCWCNGLGCLPVANGTMGAQGSFSHCVTTHRTRSSAPLSVGAAFTAALTATSLLALADSSAGAMVRVPEAAAIAHQAAGRGEFGILIDGRNPVAERQCGELFGSAGEETVGGFLH